MASGDGTAGEYEFRLDNAAKIFAAQHSRRRTTMFRIAVDLKEPVNIAALTEAYRVMLQRCPYFKVHLRKGLFWFYLERNEPVPRVEAESRYPCLYLPFQKKGVLPLRVIAYRRRIIFEVAHFLTDGTGALAFLNGLLLAYLRIRGIPAESGGLVLDPREEPDPLEFEESFLKYYRKVPPAGKWMSRAWKISGPGVKAPIHYVTEGRIRTDELKRAAAQREATVGEFLTALLLQTSLGMMKERRDRLKPIRISVPLNLRRYFPSATMRNFTLTVLPEIDPRVEEYDFDHIIRSVRRSMADQTEPGAIQQRMARNLDAERHPLVRAIPLVFKIPLLKFYYGQFLSQSFTLSFSNLGVVKIPDGMAREIEGYQLIPPPHRRALSVTAIGYKGVTALFFASTLMTRDFEARFFARLRKAGLSVSIRTNRS